MVKVFPCHGKGCGFESCLIRLYFPCRVFMLTQRFNKVYLLIGITRFSINMYLDIILQLVSTYCAIKVFNVKNPISSILFFIGLFGSVSIYFYINGLTFISLSFIIIYIGAISILFIFIIMLLDIRISEIQNNNSNSIPLAITICILLSYYFFKIYWVSMYTQPMPVLRSGLPAFAGMQSKGVGSVYEVIGAKESTNYPGIVLNNNWDNNIIDISHITSIGSILYTSHSIWLIIISIILLLSMIGSIVITIDRPSF